MTIYSSVILLTELMMMAMMIHVIRYSGFTRSEKGWYVATFTAIMLCAAAEFCAIHFDARGSGFVIPLTIITVIQFSLSPLLPVFFAGALGMRREARAVSHFFLLNVLAQIISAPFGWIFFFDEGGKYIRGNLYVIYQFFYISSLVFLIVALNIVGKRFRNRDIYTIIMVMVIMLAAILPLILYKVYTDYLGIALCACLSYIYYNDLIQEDIQAELIAKQDKISSMQKQMISGLANLIESRDLETGEHVARTSEYVKKLASFARQDGVYADVLDDHFIKLIGRVAAMHDIGKIVVSDQILKKPGRLTAEEYEEMKKHASAGGTVVREVLSGITDAEYLTMASDIATYHHEWWNGKGYPTGLKGEAIPLSARIMAIADVYDALISERCYKQAMPRERAYEIIQEESGTHFDPKLAKVFLDHKEEFA